MPLIPTLFKGQLNFMLFEVLYSIYLANGAGYNEVKLI